MNLTTSISDVYLPTHAVYIATQCAVEGLTQVLGQELRGRRISVNAVAPGRSPPGRSLLASLELIERMEKLNPIERRGQPEALSTIIALLASPRTVAVSITMSCARTAVCCNEHQADPRAPGGGLRGRRKGPLPTITRTWLHRRCARHLPSFDKNAFLNPIVIRLLKALCLSSAVALAACIVGAVQSPRLVDSIKAVFSDMELSPTAVRSSGRPHGTPRIIPPRRVG